MTLNHKTLHKGTSTMKLLLFFVLVTWTMSCVKPTSTLIRISENGSWEMGSKMGYVNAAGDTVVALGTYYYCYADTIKSFGIVLDSNKICKAIDNTGQELYQVYWFDNGPDYLSDGLFRMVDSGLVGYADSSGKIVIPAQYKCAAPFHDGKARVSYDCRRVKEGEHSRMLSDQWFFIDKKGNKIK